MLLLRILLTVAVLSGAISRLPAEDGRPAPQEWLRARDQVRQGRILFEKGVIANRQQRAQNAAKLISELLTKAKDLGASRDDSDLNNLIRGVRFLDPETAAPLATALADCALVASVDPKQIKDLASLIETKRKAILLPTEQLFAKSLAVGAPAISRECVDQALVFWPDHRDLRRNLGQTKVGERWYGSRETVMTKQGLIWDMKLGWVSAKDRARYDQGEYFDVQTKAWTTMAAANDLHAKLENRWVIQTEHLELRGTAKLVDLVDAANRLEQFYDRIFSSYASFFVRTDKRSVNDIKLLFGTFDHPRLILNIARDEKDYAKSLPRGVDSGWTAGMFIPAIGESFFYAGEPSVIYHEFTHQILEIFSRGAGGPAWMVEGAAVYTQAPIFVDGRMILGNLEANSHIRGFFAQVEQRKALSLSQTLALDDQGEWMRSTTPGQNYAAAGALVQFCMEAENRRYRADFIDFLRDNYLGVAHGYRLWNYLGLDYPTLEKNYQAWVALGPQLKR